MYARDLKRPVKKVESEVPVRYLVHEKPAMLDSVGELEYQERFAKGDKMIGAYQKKDLVAYLFAATSDTWVGEIEDWLNVPAGEVYLYDAHTAEDHRGMRIYPSLICEAMSYYKKKGYVFAMIFSSMYNIDSIKGIERCGFQLYGAVGYHNFMGLKIWKYNMEERHVKARFRNED